MAATPPAEIIEKKSLPGDEPQPSMLKTQQSSHARRSPAAAAEPLSKEEEQSTIERQLLAIIRLKEAGDDTWITELEKFKQVHPDYPLPEELKPEALKQLRGGLNADT